MLCLAKEYQTSSTGAVKQFYITNMISDCTVHRSTQFKRA